MLNEWMNTVQCMNWHDLLSALPDGCADMILTDMPYGTTACSWDTVIDLDAWWTEAHRVAKPSAAIVCTGSQPFTSRLVMSNVKRFQYEWVWDKRRGSNFLTSNQQPLRSHEHVLIFAAATPAYYPQMTKSEPYRVQRKTDGREGVYGYANRMNGNQNYSGERFPVSIQYFSVGANQLKSHPTQKPIALFEYLIRTYTRPGDLVIDPFVGSGTTALAARNTGRRFICGDFTPEYVQIARDRLAEPYTPDMFDTLLQEAAPGADQLELF